jgi:hypothetical protein
MVLLVQQKKHGHRPKAVQEHMGKSRRVMVPLIKKMGASTRVRESLVEKFSGESKQLQECSCRKGIESQHSIYVTF